MATNTFPFRLIIEGAKIARRWEERPLCHERGKGLTFSKPHAGTAPLLYKIQGYNTLRNAWSQAAPLLSTVVPFLKRSSF
jgi:hypothetical protein